jgi:hypothetical protein
MAGSDEDNELGERPFGAEEAVGWAVSRQTSEPV